MDSPQAFETAVIKKIARRILPLVLVAYCIAYIDRANVAVAALTMNKDLGFSAFTYGLGAGIFFVGYFIFEVPSNLILERVGARRWIARIMFTWGILSAACAFVTGPTSFIVVRFLLGVAESGFFPGVVLYFTYWFPNRFRARIIAVLFLAGPIANALSNIMSGAILEMNGVLDLRGWQWVFIIEAAPAVILSFVVLRRMIDRPSFANWLKPDERQWLEKELDDERAGDRSTGSAHVGQGFDGLAGRRAFDDLFSVGNGGLWDNLFPAANRQGSRFVQFHDGRRIGDTLSVWHDCALGLGLVERSKRGPSLALDRSFRHRRCRICRRWRRRELRLVAAGDVSRSGRNLWYATNVLATSLDFLERNSRRGRHRADQFDRKPWRVCWTICCWLDQRFDEQLPNGAVFSCWLLAGLGRTCFRCQEGQRCAARPITGDRRDSLSLFINRCRVRR
jgi:Major Facilitator Superfamily